jgi:sugar lactone lactonase YvrE
MQSAGRNRSFNVRFAITLQPLALIGLMAACGGAQPEPQAPPPETNLPPPAPELPPAAAAPPAAATAAPGAPAAAPADAPITLAEGFATPESVLHDPDADVYLVSNINGSPLETDDNGYITKVSPEGKVTEPKFIDGAKAEVKLNAPKGMTFGADKLYIADITFVRIFDRKTGAPAGEVEVKGSTFLNGAVTGPDGSIYVSDSGMKAGKDGFEPTGTDAVYRIEPAKKNKLTPVAKNKDLGRPNGLAADQSGVWVVTFGTGELYRISPKGQKEAAVKLPKGQLDGLVALDGGTVLVSSWEGSAVYRGTGAGPFEAVISGVKSPAGIGYDAKRKRLLVPSFMGNAVQINPLK